MFGSKKKKGSKIGKKGSVSGRYGGDPFLLKSTSSGNKTKKDGSSDQRTL